MSNLTQKIFNIMDVEWNAGVYNHADEGVNTGHESSDLPRLTEHNQGRMKIQVSSLQFALFSP